jgi:hypothetical protein
VPDFLAVAALVVAAAALLISFASYRRAAPPPAVKHVEALPEDVRGLRQEVAALRAEGADAMRHLAVVRYDAFEDMGGHLSWSIALLDDRGDGVLLTSIHGRSEARTYAKQISDWACELQLSPEETEAISLVRPG